MASRYKMLITLCVICLVINPLNAFQNTPEREDNLIMMPAVVLSRGGLVQGLKRDAFTIIDEKVVRPVEFFDAADRPVSLGIIVDNSGSMKLSNLKLISEELGHFVAGGHSDNEYFLVSFSGAPNLLADWGSGNDMLARKFDVEEPSRGTAVYDSLLAALEKLHKGRHSRHALLLISDGQDSSSRKTFKDARNALRGSDVMLYALGVLNDPDVGSSLGIEGQGVLDGLSGITGGTSFYPKSRKEIREVFSLIAGELRHQYRLGFRPDKSDAPNKWRRLKIKVTVPPKAASEIKNLSVRTREGYYTR